MYCSSSIMSTFFKFGEIGFNYLFKDRYLRKKRALIAYIFSFFYFLQSCDVLIRLFLSLQPMTEKLTLVIVDDDPDDRELFIEAVSELGNDLECIEFPGGLEILSRLKGDKGFRPDYIFLDMNMPLMNGKECLVELRKLKELDSAQIIIYTTSQRQDDVKIMLELGANAFLIKPSVFSHLRTAIKYILSGEKDPSQIEGLFQK